MQVEVILREDVKNLGRAGALVRVKPGYARNFLLPRGLAYEASEGNKKRIVAEQKARSSRLAVEKGEAESLAARINVVSFTITAKAGEGDRLFGSVTSQDLADRLAELGFTIDKRKIDLEHPIKQLGAHTVPIRLHPEVKAEIKVTIAPE